MESGGPDIRLEGVRKAYGEVVAVAGIDLEIAAGEFFTMLGPSGSGKTTTLRMIAGFEEPDSGTVSLRGVTVNGRAPYERDVNTVFQDYALFPHMSVADNVAYGMRVRKVAKSERLSRASEALEMVRLSGYGERKPSELSGGQRQRVALARSIVNRPQVLLLDEPLGALDLKLREQMQVELKEIQAEVGITFVYVTHDQEEALTMSNRIAVFNEGRVEQIGTPMEIYEHPANPFVANFVGTSNVLERDGKRFTIRPEKIHILTNVPSASSASRPGADGSAGGTENGFITEAGTLREIAYAGMITRYFVELERGGELQVVRQNLESTSAEVGERRGEKMKIGWRPEHAVPIQ